jgi:hypothetical protein
MSEAMTVETIVEAYWRLQGYWTKMRFPFQTMGGGWADIDVIAYHPEQKTFVISESKVRGPKKDVYAYTEYARKKYGNIFEYDEDNYLRFLKYIDPICSKKLVFENFRQMVDKLIIQLVSNYYVGDSELPKVKEDILKEIRDSIPKGVRIELRFETTLDIINEIIKLEDSIPQGRRYGHPVIDIARELNRYLHPDIKYAGREKREVEAIKEKIKKSFMDSLKL